MPDSVRPNSQPARAPQITALSTAYPLQFETQDAPRDTDRAPQNPSPERAPHRHDAGE